MSYISQATNASYFVFSFIHRYLSCLHACEVQRHFLQPEAYSFHFWCERGFKAQNITFGIFVIKTK